MSWNSTARKQELPPNWKSLRRGVLEDAGFRCRWVENGKRCTARATHVDHKKRGNDHSLDNLQALCERHHRIKTALEAKEARYGLAPRRGKLFEPHPGIIER